jgi:CRISP-associated protein Cas1
VAVAGCERVHNGLRKMKHLVVSGYGTSLGISGERVICKRDGIIIREVPLNRLKSVFVSKEGVSVSSNLILDFAGRGIQMFFTDFRNRSVAAVVGTHQHAVVQARKAQFSYVESNQAIDLSRCLIESKIKNQRSVLLYFSKYKGIRPEDKTQLLLTAEILLGISNNLNSLEYSGNWRSAVMGCEGNAAAEYWNCISRTQLMGKNFSKREGRGAEDLTNRMLNFGYALLESHVWRAISNAGLEPFAGILHVDRPGKPSLVLDLMEEYRPWVVDRNVIKLSGQIDESKTSEIGDSLKRNLINNIQDTILKRYTYRGKRLTLESIIQRQVYRLNGVFRGTQKYKPYTFRW